MNNIVKKAGILLGIFIVAVGVYLIWNQKAPTDKTEAVYTKMEEAALPLVYADMYGSKINLMHGYVQDMGQAAARDSITVLPEDRQLVLHVLPYSQTVTAVSYEIRSLDLERLVERTEVSTWEEEDGGIKAVLPIQNLLTKESEYLLDIKLQTAQQGEIHYYTRIMWSDNPNVEQILTFATDFSSKTFDYNQAKELVTYLETNATEDNSNLGYVTIRSSFSQLTWGDLGVSPEGGVRVTLKELDGIMANVQLDYLVSREPEGGSKEIYKVSENFTLKWNTQRIYMMNYERRMSEYFNASGQNFAGKRILLGINHDESATTLKSPDKRHIGFVINGDLWGYDEKEQSAVRIFSFGSGTDDGLRSGYDQHNIKILSVKDTGDMDFLVYGYMNRGAHEGSVGVTMYRYSMENGSISERFFTPVQMSYEVLREDMDRLSYLGGNDMLYLLLGHAVYGIDLTSNEYMVVADGLQEGSFAVSSSGGGFAWQEGSDLYASKVIHIMDLNTGIKQDITGPEGDLLRTLGFVGTDFIYGLAHEGDEWVVNGRMEELPMYALQIVDEALNVETRYEKDGYYISGVYVKDSRVHLNRISRLGEKQYAFAEEDTLVSNNAKPETALEGIGWYASTDKRKLYFVQLDQEIKSSKTVHTTATGAISYDKSETLNLESNVEVKDTLYYAYSGGHLQGISPSFSDAVNLAYDGLGIVTDSDQRILWDRVNRSSLRNIKDPMVAAKHVIRYIENGFDTKTLEEGVTILDARGCTLNQILYFIDQGCPVVAYREDGSYDLISGYDQYNITLYDPATGSSTKMGLGDGANYYNSLENDFLCTILTE